MSYRYFGYRRNRRRLRWPLVLVVAAIVLAVVYAARSYASECRGYVYLTLDTGNMRHARDIADTLRRHGVLATFFLANEKTTQGDYALEPAWNEYWRTLAAEGHAFGTHTWRHGRFLADDAQGRVRYRPQFGERAGTALTLAPNDVCEELRSVGNAFKAATGRELDALWRAPGGSDVADGDVLPAHLGIWSRKDPFAPMLDPLIAGLRQRGFCFRTLREHPQYRARDVATQLAASRRSE